MKQNLKIFRKMKEISSENDKVKCINSSKIMVKYEANCFPVATLL